MKKFYSIIFIIFITCFHTDYARNSNSIKNNTIKTDSVVTVDSQVIPGEFQLYQNYPNPFNPTTEIKYSVPEKSHVVLKVYNALGKEVALLVDAIQQAGTYKATFAGRDLFSGVYFYRLQAKDYVKVRKMILLK